MTAEEIEAARVALQRARAVFASHDGFDAPSTAPGAQTLWDAAETVLQAVTTRGDLHGHALIQEARGEHRLSLGGAHALVALRGAVDRSTDIALQDDFPAIASAALQALTAAVDGVSGTASPATTDAAAMSSAATEQRRPALVPDRRLSTGTPPVSSAALTGTPPVSSAPLIDVARPRRTMAPGVLLGALMLVVIAVGAGSWYLLQARRTPSSLADGIAAYARGSRETARIAFVRAVREDPRNVTPLIFLGRIAREEGNMVASRRFLDAAVRRAPTNALANRELASSVLADGDAEVARRFYVRALQLDPADRLSQGFLGCALFRLGRLDEAKRWTDRAGPGDWSGCLETRTPPIAPLRK